MLALGFFGTVLGVAIIGTAFLLICLILLQKNRGSGLSGAFGGVGGHSAFGTKTGDFLTWLTVGLATLFLILCVIGNFVFTPEAVARPKVPVATTPESAGTDSTSSTESTPVESTPAESSGEGDAAEPENDGGSESSGG